MVVPKHLYGICRDAATAEEFHEILIWLQSNDVQRKEEYNAIGL